MSATVSAAARLRHRLSLENQPLTMAKADLNNVETPDRQLIGRGIGRCFEIAGLSQKEAAALIGRDPAQIARWVSGAERAQMDALFAVKILRTALVMAFAEIAGEGVDVQTVITIRRRA